MCARLPACLTVYVRVCVDQKKRMMSCCIQHKLEWLLLLRLLLSIFVLTITIRQHTYLYIYSSTRKARRKKMQQNENANRYASITFL